MRKLNYSPKTLDDEIIRDGLCAIATMSDSPISRDKYFVVGGIAVQSYLPSSCRRGTHDIDLAVLERLNTTSFKEFSKTVSEYLSDNKYNINYKESQNAHCLDYSKDDESSYIEFSRHTEKRFNERIDNLSRERKHARTKIVEGRTDSYIVSSPEDIIVPKLVRCVNSLRRNRNFEEYVSRMENLSDEEIANKLRYIDQLREEAILNIGDVRLTERLRFVSDLYDIRLISELTGVNSDYFLESCRYWNSLKNNSEERGFIFRAVLPESFIESPVLNH